MGFRGFSVIPMGFIAFPEDLNGSQWDFGVSLTPLDPTGSPHPPPGLRADGDADGVHEPLGLGAPGAALRPQGLRHPAAPRAQPAAQGPRGACPIAGGLPHSGGSAP